MAFHKLPVALVHLDDAVELAVQISDDGSACHYENGKPMTTFRAKLMNDPILGLSRESPYDALMSLALYMENYAKKVRIEAAALPPEFMPKRPPLRRKTYHSDEDS